jgi:hypothetical protein
MQNKTWAYWIVGIVAIVLIGLVIYQMNHQNGDSQNTNQTSTTPQNNGAASSTPTSTPATGTTGGAGNAAYNAALAIYQKSGFRIQFSQCHGTPGHLVIKAGQKYMLDNRDNAKHTIKVGPYTYSLGAYGFQVVTAQNLGLNNVTCDGGGAAQVNIEK